jgi:hypothetical protein
MDPASEPLVIPIADVGATHGDWISIQALGYFAYTDATPEVGTGLWAVFSGSSSLEADQSQLNRVIDAVPAGTPFETPDTFRMNCPYPQDTDIPEDFSVNGLVVLQVPTDGDFLFISAADVFFSDNVDSDSNFRVAIRRLGGNPLDLDGDGLAESDEIIAAVGCLTGPDQGVIPGCDATDVDRDNDVDMIDFAALQTLVLP